MTFKNMPADAETKFLPDVKSIRVIGGAGKPGRDGLNGNPIRLDAREVMEREDYTRAVQFAWHLVAAPDGSRARIAYGTLVRAHFFPDLSGVYLIKLEAVTESGTLEYVTRIAMSESGEQAAKGMRPAYQIRPAMPQSAKVAPEMEPKDQAAMKIIALSAGKKRPQARPRRSLFSRLRNAFGMEIGRRPAFGDPVSTF